ncbi:MAG: hypothetical protein CMC38_00275 [Flavobacteriaceae bacterium]|nr:hypothetical protein [Flavobacteriaceae bacterium]
MFNFIINFIKATFGAIAMFVLFLVMCLVGYGLFWFVEFFFLGFVESEWITNEYIVTAIHFLFQGEYADIIEVILVLGFGGVWVFGQSQD